MKDVVEDTEPDGSTHHLEPRSTEHVADPQHPSPKVIQRQVMSLAWPAIVELVLQTLTQIVDMVMVGRLGPAAIAAVGLANQPSFFLMAIFQALAVGATAVIARSIGAGKPRDAENALKQSVLVAVVIGSVLSVVFVLLAPQIITFMGAEAESFSDAVTYFRIVVGGLVFTAITVLLTASLRGAGDTRTPMAARSVANLLNVLLNWLLIFGVGIFPRMGVAGAGLATVITRAVTVLIIAFVIHKGKTLLRWQGALIAPFDFDVIRRIFRVGLPAAVEQIIMRSGQLIFVRTVAGMGTNAMAAHQIAMNLESISIMPGFGFAIAATTLVGQHLGARKPLWAERAGRQTGRLAVGVMSTMGLVLFFGGPSLVSIYTQDPDVIQMGGLALRILALCQPFMALSFTMGGALRGAGDTRFVMISTTVGIWGVRLIVAYYLGVVLNLGIAGAWLGMVADQIVRSILTTLRFRGGAWKKIRV